jgi:hypothetical protein
VRAALLLLLTLTVLGAAVLPGPRVQGGAEVTGAGQKPAWFNGDANCDGVIDSLDALAVLQFEAGVLQELVFPEGGDPNEDSTINSIDALLILQFHAGLIPDRTPNSCIAIPPGPGPS